MSTAEEPPIDPPILLVVSIPLGFHLYKKVLVNLWKTLTYVLDRKPIKVDHHDAARAGCQIAPVAIGADMALQAFPPAEAQQRRLLRRDDEAGAVQLHAG